MDFVEIEEKARRAIYDFFSERPDKSKYLFIGAGLSSPIFSGTNLILENIKKDIPDSKNLLPNDIDEQGRYNFKQKLNFYKNGYKKEYQKFLNSHFNISIPYRRKIYDHLAKLPFNGYITTNFENLFELQMQENGIELNRSWYPGSRLSFKDAKRPFVYLHGSIKDRSSDLVFCMDEYEIAYNRENGILNGILEQILLEDVLFLGFSMNEDESEIRSTLNKILEYNNRYGTPKGRHLLFRGIELIQGNDDLMESDNQKKDMFKKKMASLEIDVVEYLKQDRLYSGLDDLFEKISKDYVFTHPKSNFLSKDIYN